MKKLLLSICCILAMGAISISLNSCNGCTEEAVSRMYDVDVDLDDDGDYGDRSGETNNRNTSFKGTPAYKAKCPDGSGNTYKRKGPGTIDCENCEESWYDHSPSNGPAPENWD